jgi:predicted kinase
MSSDKVIDNIPSETQKKEEQAPKMNWANIVSKDTPPNSVPQILPSINTKNPSKSRTAEVKPRVAVKPPTLSELIDEHDKVLIVLRGLPGSGKTTFAGNLCKQAADLGMCKPEICSSDFFFEKEDGSYEYNPRDIGASHRWSQTELSDMIEDGISYIILDNINSQSWEAKRYVEPAVNNGYHVEIVEVLSPWCKNFDELEKRCLANGHNVPVESIRKMAKKWHKVFTVDSIMSSTGPTRSRPNNENTKKKKKSKNNKIDKDDSKDDSKKNRNKANQFQFQKK